MKTFMLHLQSSTRSLRRSFSSTLPLILLLAAGCGIASSLLHDSGLIVQPSLSYANQDQLVRPVIRRAKGFSPDIPVDWIKPWSSAGSLSGFTPYSFIAGAVYQPTSSMSATRAVIVTAQPDILSLLGVAPIIGRSFDPKGAGYEVIISYDVWQRQFSGDPGVTTKSLLVNRRIYQVIGVMPEGFYFPAELHESTVWITQNDILAGQRVTAQVIARLRDGFSRTASAGELNRLSGAGSPAFESTKVSLETYAGILRAPLNPTLNVMRAVAVLLWLVSTVILLGLSVTRLLARRKEIVLTSWLGATAVQTAVAILSETAVIILCSLPVSAVIAIAMHRQIFSLLQNQASWFPYSPVPTRLVSILGILLLASVVTICAALLALSKDILFLENERAAANKFGLKVGALLVSLELGLALMVVQIARDLSVQQYQLQSAALGFYPDGLLIVDMEAASAGQNLELQLQQYLHVLSATRQMPGVDSAALATSLPIVKSTNVQLNLFHNSEEIHALVRAVSPDFIELEGIPVVEGRSCLATDSGLNEEVAIVNKAFSMSYFPDTDPIGKTIDLGDRERVRVVGLIDNIRQLGIDRPPAPEVILCLAQMPQSQLLGAVLNGSSSNMIVKVRNPSLTTAKQLQSAIAQLAPSIAISNVRNFREAIDLTFANRTAIAILFRWTAMLSLFMAVVGFYAMLDYRRQLRQTEMAIRIALGADLGHVIRRIVLDAIHPAIGALAVGLALTWCSTRLIQSSFQSSLTGVSLRSVLLMICVVLAAVAVSIVPAGRKCLPASLIDVLKEQR